MANNGSSPVGAGRSGQPGPARGSLSPAGPAQGSLPPAVPASIRPPRPSVAVPAGRGLRILAQKPVIDGFDLQQMLSGIILVKLVNV